MAARAGLGHAEHFAFEQEAALQIGLLLAKLSLGCLKALESCRGQSVFAEGQEARVDCVFGAPMWLRGPKFSRDNRADRDRVSAGSTLHVSL